MHLCRKLDPNTTEEKVAAALQEIDADGDGEVSAEEFLTWWRRSHPVSSAGAAVEAEAVSPEAVAELMAVLLPYKDGGATAAPPAALVLHGCRALREVAIMGPEYRDEIISGGEDGGRGLLLLLDWLDKAPTEAAVAATCAVLAAVCVGSPSAVGLVEAAHGLELLASIIGNPARRRDSTAAAVEALTALLVASTFRAATCRSLIRAGGLQALAAALRAAALYRADLKLTIKICQALFHLTEPPPNRTTACEAGVLSELVRPPI